MKKVIIIGCPGSGKSTFARALHEKTALPLFHLDMLYWNADRTTVPKEIFLKRLYKVLKNESWIIDGNYSSTMEMRMEQCDTVFFLDFPLEVCLDGIKQRHGKKRSDIPWVEDGFDEEFTEFIKNYNRDNRPKVFELIEKYTDKNIIIFRSREEADEYIKKDR